MIWSEQFKVRVRESEKSQRLNLVVKSLVVLMIREKYKKQINYQEVYTEFPLGKEIICDVFHQNNKTNEIVCYEIQKEDTQTWKDKVEEKYSKFGISHQTIPIKKLSNYFPIMCKQIEKYII